VVDADDRAQRVEVTAGPARDGRTEVLTGLTGDERVIVDPPELRSGQLIKILQ
jgi:hypothetical protein